MTTRTFDRLAEACDGRLGFGTSDDAVCGVVPTFVAAPGSGSDTAALLQAADEFGLSVVARGTGTKLHWGVAPAGCDLLVDMSRLDRIIDHTEGDMVVEVEAGCGLDKLADVLASKNQRLSVDATGYDDGTRSPGTVGGLIATARSGSRRLSLGAVRDLLLGVTMVRFDGVIAACGGRVVKNVAGYDLGKLLTGSFGTLGIIVSATFRLHPLPEAAAWVSTTAADPQIAADRATTIIDSQQEPATLDFDRAGNDEPISVVAGFEGSTAGVRARTRHAAAALGDHAAVTDPPGWHGFLPDGPYGTLVEVTVPVASLPTTLDVIAETARSTGLDVPVRGSAGLGVVAAAVASGAEPATVSDFVSRLRDRIADTDGVVVVVHAPEEVRERIDMWGPVGAQALTLMRRVKEQFDPGRLLSPGRFVQGI